MDASDAIKTFERRAGRWALQTSTIIGAASIVAAAIGGTADAATGLPLMSAVTGLVAGGLAAIFLPGQDAAPLVAGLQQVAAAVARRDAAGAEAAAVPSIGATIGAAAVLRDAAPAATAR